MNWILWNQHPHKRDIRQEHNLPIGLVKKPALGSIVASVFGPAKVIGVYDEGLSIAIQDYTGGPHRTARSESGWWTVYTSLTD